MRHALLAAAALGLLAPAAPALADTDKETPGFPCAPGGGKGTGNPCNGNNGNPSPQGNVGTKGGGATPDPFTIERPGNDRGAFITQIGDVNNATITQSANTQYAFVGQAGDRNRADVAQRGTGDHYVWAGQFGNDNSLGIEQSGAGTQVAFAKQWGDGNEMSLDQQGGTVSSGVAAYQFGDDNEMSLTQSGDNNQAILGQEGSENTMSATQTGGNNRLIWTQTGDGLSDMGIVQEGGGALQVTQSR